MISQITTAYRSDAAGGIVAAVRAVAGALTSHPIVVARAASEKAERSAVRIDRFLGEDRTTGVNRVVSIPATCAPATAPEMVTFVANFWKQLTGGTGPPALELLRVT